MVHACDIMTTLIVMLLSVDAGSKSPRRLAEPQSVSGAEFQLWVRDLAGVVHSAEVRSTATVGTLRTLVPGLTQNEQFSYQGRILQDESLLSDVGISAEVTIDVTRKDIEIDFLQPKAFEKVMKHVRENGVRKFHFKMSSSSSSSPGAQYPGIEYEVIVGECSIEKVSGVFVKFKLDRAKLIMRDGPEHEHDVLEDAYAFDTHSHIEGGFFMIQKFIITDDLFNLIFQMGVNRSPMGWDHVPKRLTAQDFTIHHIQHEHGLGRMTRTIGGIFKDVYVERCVISFSQ